jgi:alpha-tubulin suppressor-like RCC1 family protein
MCKLETPIAADRAPAVLVVRQVAAGLGHTVACFTDGSAYAWGLNNDGQLGLGHDSSCTSPQLVDAAALEELDVVQVTGCLLSAGQLHMVMNRVPLSIRDEI